MKRIIVLITVLTFVLPCTLWATSLWSKSNKRGLYVDNKARLVGDIVTILVVETTNATNKASTKLSKDSSISGGVGTGYLAENLGWGSDAKDSFKGDGETSRENKLNGKITAQVMSVLPNQNMVVEGSRMVKINKEKQKMVITGVIRPQDVRADNTVLSTYVADAQIEYQGKGILSEKANPGIFTRLLGWLYIF